MSKEPFKANMKVISKLTHSFDNGIKILISGNIYEAELTPKDPLIFKPLEPRIVIKCEDNKFRVFVFDWRFESLAEWRDKQINSILEDE